MCGCGCGLALVLAEAQQRQHVAREVAGNGLIQLEVVQAVDRPARGWEALKQTLRATLGAQPALPVVTAA